MVLTSLPLLWSHLIDPYWSVRNFANKAGEGPNLYDFAFIQDFSSPLSAENIRQGEERHEAVEVQLPGWPPH